METELKSTKVTKEVFENKLPSNLPKELKQLMGNVYLANSLVFEIESLQNYADFEFKEELLTTLSEELELIEKQINFEIHSTSNIFKQHLVHFLNKLLLLNDFVQHKFSFLDDSSDNFGDLPERYQEFLNHFKFYLNKLFDSPEDIEKIIETILQTHSRNSSYNLNYNNFISETLILTGERLFSESLFSRIKKEVENIYLDNLCLNEKALVEIFHEWRYSDLGKGIFTSNEFAESILYYVGFLDLTYLILFPDSKFEISSEFKEHLFVEIINSKPDNTKPHEL